MSPKEKILAFFQHEPEWYVKHCQIEMAWLVIFLVSFYKYYSGKSTNKAIAENFAVIVVPSLFDEF